MYNKSLEKRKLSAQEKMHFRSQPTFHPQMENYKNQK